MCGIGGILRTDGQPIPEEWLDAIDARIAYRGPDGHGRFRDRVEIDVAGTPALRAGSNTPGSENRGTGKRIIEVAFVHRRLSIIDHEGGHQPMVSERGRNDKEGLVAVVFNGCIYNHRELRKELEGKGHTFVTDHSDTEVLIHGWREWGEELIDHLEGMYAFALWDRCQRTLALGRDWFGEKPLFRRAVTEHDKNRTFKSIAFSSDLGILAEIPPSHPILDGNELPHWTASYLQTGTKMWLPVWDGGVGTIPTGEVELWDAKGHITSHVPVERRNCHAQGATIATSEIESLLDQAVIRRLEADVPLGCFLSGGVDSSLIAHFAKRHDSALCTFNVRMPDVRFDETSHAHAVASRIGTRHTTLDAAIAPADDLVFLVSVLAHPFGDSSILPTYWVSKAARQHAKVALVGDGGDEMFLGYERYRAANLLSRHWRQLKYLPANALYRLHPKSCLHKLARLRDMAGDYGRLGLAAMETTFKVAEIELLLNAPFKNELDCRTNDDPVSSLREFDIETYLPNDLLRKVDTASMACGLEVRCPFLDRDLARAALSMPIDQLMPRGQRKGLLRQIARKYLPKEIVDRPKMGFAIPIGEWFRSDYGGMKTLLLDHLNSTEPFGPIQLNSKAVQRFIDEHMSGKRDHGQRLFTLLTLSIWAKGVGRESVRG